MLTKTTDCNSTVRFKAGPDDGLAEGQFTAYASVFGVKDSVGDVVFPGAFTKSLARWGESGYPIPLLFGHMMDDPDMNLGHIADATEDDHGLLVTGALDLANPKSTQVYRMLKGKRINQMSYAYEIISGGVEVRKADGAGDDEQQGEEIYALRELKLYEISVVTIGANEETEILAVKQAASAAKRTLELLKAGRVLSAKNEAELRGAYDSIGRVLQALDGDGTEGEASGQASSRRALEDVHRSAGVNPSVYPSVLEMLGHEIGLSA